MMTDVASPAEIKRACRQELERLQREFSISNPVKLLWTKKLLDYRGLALVEEGRIALDANQLEERSLDQWITDTRHEYAHFLAFDRGQDAPHDQVWRQAARDVGVPEIETQSYDVDKEEWMNGIHTSPDIHRCHYCRRFPAGDYCRRHRLRFCNSLGCMITPQACPRCYAEDWLIPDPFSEGPPGPDTVIVVGS